MASINKAILIGNLGKDPELRYTPAGRPVANFSMATTEYWTDKNGEKQKRTEWHNIVFWGRQAEVANQYLKKGRSCYVEGRIVTRSWEDKDRVKHYRTEIEGFTLQLLSGSGYGGGGDAPNQPDEYYDSFPEPGGRGGSEPSGGRGGGGSEPSGGGAPASGPAADGDDLPF